MPEVVEPLDFVICIALVAPCAINHGGIVRSTSHVTASRDVNGDNGLATPLDRGSGWCSAEGLNLLSFGQEAKTG